MQSLFLHPAGLTMDIKPSVLTFCDLEQNSHVGKDAALQKP